MTAVVAYCHVLFITNSVLSSSFLCFGLCKITASVFLFPCCLLSVSVQGFLRFFQRKSPGSRLPSALISSMSMVMSIVPPDFPDHLKNPCSRMLIQKRGLSCEGLSMMIWSSTSIPTIFPALINMLVDEISCGLGSGSPLG